MKVKECVLMMKRKNVLGKVELLYRAEVCDYRLVVSIVNVEGE